MALSRAERIVKIRAGLHELYLPYFDALCRAVSAEWAPIQGLRTIETQETLFRQGRTLTNLVWTVTSPTKIVTNARGGESPHNWGMATDWALFNGSDPIWNHTRWAEYEKSVKDCGLIWGADWNGNNVHDSNDFDRPHNQMRLKVPYKTLAQVMKSQGRAGALEYLETMVLL